MEEQTNKKKILVVEDEVDAKNIFLDILGDANFEVKGAEDGEKALSILQQEPLVIFYIHQLQNNLPNAICPICLESCILLTGEELKIFLLLAFHQPHLMLS